MTINQRSFVKFTNYLKNLALLLLVVFITTKCDIIKELTTEPVPRAGETNPSRPSSTKEIALRNDIVAYAKKYQGIKYKAAGKTPSTGFDCSGFTSYVMNHFEIDLSPSSQMQAKQGVSKTIEAVEPGDLIFFRRGKNDPIFHVAMVVSNDKKSLKVIHSTSRGVVVDDLLASEYWKPKIDSARDVVEKAL